MNPRTLEEVPPESPPTGAEADFITAFQIAHPEFSVTRIRKVLRHCALELALRKFPENLEAAVEGELGKDPEPPTGD